MYVQLSAYPPPRPPPRPPRPGGPLPPPRPPRPPDIEGKKSSQANQYMTIKTHMYTCIYYIRIDFFERVVESTLTNNLYMYKYISIKKMCLYVC